jgi:hypothetical protein
MIPALIEQRYITIGMDGFGRMLVVVYTWRGDNICAILGGFSAVGILHLFP